MKLGAQGAVVAEGGTATLSASALDVSCVTGDLDLDVGSMTATNGRFLALANGVVRLRGEYSATRDIQLLSRKDAIDAVGATLATADAGAALSGFVRLATFSSNATIDATDAAIRTGASDAQSGDVLLQIARSGGESSTAQIEVVTVGARRMPDGAIVTRIRGTMRGRAIRAASSSGSGRVAFGRTAHRLMLRGHGGHVSGVAGGAKMSIRGGSSRATFTVELREASAEAGELTELEIDRAGFHAKGKFRRPRAD
jgi:hypothetical protein